MSFTSRQIQAMLMERRQSNASLVRIAEYVPKDWFECDIFEITLTGFMREYEVKTSRRDFFGDAKKINDRVRSVFGHRQAADDRTKHERMAAGDRRGPKQFWFVVPDDLVTVDEVPAWAGLIMAKEARRPIEVKPAPPLHQKICDPGIIEHAVQIARRRYETLYINAYLPNGYLDTNYDPY